MQPLADRGRRLVRGAVRARGGGISAAGLYVVAAVPPTDATYYPKCQFHQLTGLHCPGCGMTRALHAGMNGRFEQELAYNVLAPVFLPVFVLSVGRTLWGWAWGGSGGGTEYRPRRWVKWTPWLVFAALLAFWVLRTLPVYPFTYLAPHELPP